VFFSQNTPLLIRQELMEVIVVSYTQHYDRYLGLPAIIGRSKSSTFSGIKSKIWAKINGWKKKSFFPMPGKRF
jgi:hypothetical protein